MQRKELEQMIETYGRDLFSFCCFVTHNRQDAEELYQETFLKMYESMERMSVEKNAKSFLMSVALNLYRNEKRKRAVRNRVTGAPCSAEEMEAYLASGERGTEERIVLEESCRSLRRAVERLPDKYRLPILLYYMEELPQKEIARILRLSEGTVKTRLRRAKVILRRELEGVEKPKI